MAEKLIFPGVGRNAETISGEVGDLVLLLCPNKYREGAVLGVLKGKSMEGDERRESRKMIPGILLNGLYVLKRGERTLGGIIVPEIMPATDMNTQTDSFSLSAITELCIGQQKILDWLRLRENSIPYRHHAEWIEKLRKPYILESR